MKVICILFLTYTIAIPGISTLKVNHPHPNNRLKENLPRSSNIRLVHATDLVPGEYNYSVLINYKHYKNGDRKSKFFFSMCYGVLLARRWIVTVAHCFDKALLDMVDREAFTTVAWKVIWQDSWAKIGPGLRGRPDLIYFVEQVFVSDLYDPRYGESQVDVALLNLYTPVPADRVTQPSRIDDKMLGDGSYLYHPVQDCWTVGSKYTKIGDPDHFVRFPDNSRRLSKMKVTVGNARYCDTLQSRLDNNTTRLKLRSEYVCARANETVNPDATACLDDDGAALVCGHRLLGLLSKRMEKRECYGENAFGVYVYLGHGTVYNWMRGIVSGTNNPGMYGEVRSNASVSGSVGRNGTGKTFVTAFLVAVSVLGSQWR